jgi:hypothetical protein
MEARPLARLYVSTITVAEAWAGALRSPHRDRLIALWSAFLEPFAGRVLPSTRPQRASMARSARTSKLAAT